MNIVDWSKPVFRLESRVKLPDEAVPIINEQVQRFATALSENGQSASYYAGKRRADKKTALKNIIASKKAEFIASLAMRKFGFPVCRPDVEIRTGKNKGWKPDLVYDLPNGQEIHAHVKVCTDSTLKKTGDYSWTFNVGNSDGSFGGRDRLFDLPVDAPDLIVLLHMMDESSDEATVKAVLPWSIARPLLKPPIIPKFRGIKLCLYFKYIRAKILELMVK